MKEIEIDKLKRFVQEDQICRAGTIFKDTWKSLEKDGHEIAYHAHGLIGASVQEKENIITQGIKNLKDLGFNPVSFRGGRFHLNASMIKILEKNGIKYDSSVVVGLRETFDNGTIRCDHIGANPSPYYLSYEDHKKAGDSNILELPINRYPKIPCVLWYEAAHGGHRRIMCWGSAR